MSALRVGQRVRVIGFHPPLFGYSPSFPCPIGWEGVIVRETAGGYDWIVDFGRKVHEPTNLGETEGRFADYELVPLTDPGAEAFLESIRKLKPLHEEPRMVKVKA